MNKPQESHDPTNEENQAIDGLLREYARTGGPGDDEQLVRSVLERIESGRDEPHRSSNVSSAKTTTGHTERDWPWLFGRGFWKVNAAIALLCVFGIAGNAWITSQAQADPTEVTLFTRPRFAPGDDANLRVLVRNANLQSPLANAKVRVVLVGYGITQNIATASTDDDGIVDITADLDQQLQEGTYTFQVSVAADTGTAMASQDITVVRSYRTMVSTDKPLYKPGQTIHMRALSLNIDSMTPAPQRSVQFVVRDGKGNKVFAARPDTSDFGIASADFKLADQVNEGDYQIAVSVGDTTSERTVQVRHYVLPKFRVNLKTDRNYYAPGQEVTLTLNADYMFGKPTAGADVQIEAATQVAGGNVFQKISGTTNAEGLFEATFKLKNRLAGTQANGGNAQLFLSASVTDKTGETNSQSISRTVAQTAIQIEVFPESGELVPGVENTLYILTAFPDGTPAKTTIKTQSGTEVTTNEVGLAKIKLTPRVDELELTLTARDETTGVSSTSVKQLRVDNDGNNVLLRTDRAVYRQGDSAQLTVLSGSPAKRAFVDVIRNGRSLTTTSIDLVDSKGEYVFDLPPDVLGTVQVQAYCIQPNGRISRDTKVIQIQPADQLQVTATLNAETYKPAEKALITFLVQSQNGDPVEAALSLSIVDEAVFALNDARPGLEEMYFLIQEELLKPRYQFITRPPGDFPPDAIHPQAQVEEAQVVRFSAAEATDADPPDTASGESFSRRIRVVEARRTEQVQSLLRLMGTVPCVVFAFLAGLFLVYSSTRLVHRSADIESSIVASFRSEMRLLFWMSILSIVGVSVVAAFVDQTGLGESQWLICIVLLVVGGIGTAFIAAPALRIRKMLDREQFAPLFSRFIPIVPCLYFLGILACVGYLFADAIDGGAISYSTIGTRLAACLIALAVCLGCLGFLRRVLTEARSWKQNLISITAHQCAILFPVAALALIPPFLQSTGSGPTLSAEVEFGEAATDSMGGVMFGGMGGMGGGMGGMGGGMQDFTSSAGGFGPLVGLTQRQQAMSDRDEVAAPRIRRFFPETLLWQPQLLTDANGTATLSVPLADSITSWRLAGSAVARNGNLGSFQRGLRVFQDFFVDIQMPVQLTQNDELSIPIAIFNYLNDPQTIVLEAAEADWFEFVDDQATKSVEAAANEVLSSSYRIRVLTPGRHSLNITAKGTVLADAIERTVHVEPDGVRNEVVANGKFVGQSSEVVRIPQQAIAGGNDLFVKLYPGGFSQVMEGMDSIFQMPHGCFEQTSSTTYPNVLVLNYLRETQQVNPDVEMKALEYIAAGYQRLLSFEVDGGGFDWFGDAPANETLTAYGLHEFIDMAQVYEIDAELITRTRKWLLEQMRTDGTWSSEGLHQINAPEADSEDHTLRQTAYVVWALARTGNLDELDNSIGFLQQNTDTENAYILALVANALAACQCDNSARDAVERLSKMARQDEAGRFWTSEDTGLTYSRGNSLAVETTALVVQAMNKTKSHPKFVSQALDWITSKRDGRGTWDSTQATVQAMRALLTAGSAGKITQDTRIQITVNGQSAKPLTITEETGDVFHLVGLTEYVRNGENEISLSVDNDSLLSYQVVSVHYLPRTKDSVATRKILEIDTNYGQRELTVDDLLTVEVRLRYNRPENAPMTLVDLGVPPGFEIETQSFRDLVRDGVIRKFEPKGQQVSLYFDSIPGNGEPTQIEYQLRAKYPVKVKTPGNVAYQYYEPEVRDMSEVEVLIVR